SITINYVLYILLYFKVFKMGVNGEIKGIWRGKIIPILASIGSLIILVGSIGNPVFWANSVLSLIILVCAIVFWKYQDKNIITEE
ncbi:MAG: amino acid permease, partial [Clostridium sp.]